MIQFTISLSVNQIACLRAIRSYKDNGGSLFNGLNMWPQGTRMLLAEKLLTHSSQPVFKENGKPDGVVGWDITEKGRLLLKLVELDIQDAAMEIESTERKMLQASGEKQ